MKHNWKKVLTLVLAAAFVIPGTLAVAAEEEIQVLVDGEQITFDQPPIMQNDRVLVPLRAVGEALGCEVHWYENTQSIGIGRNGNSLDDVVLKVGYPRVLKLTTNNVVTKVTEIDQPPIVQNDRTLVPIRALAEALNAKVDWDGEKQTVTVTSNLVDPEWEFEDGIAIVKTGRYSCVYQEDGTLLLPGQYDSIVRYGDVLVATNVSYVAKSATAEFYDMDGSALMEQKVNPEILYAFGNLAVKWTDWSEEPLEDGTMPSHYTVLDREGTIVLEDADEETYQAFKQEHFPVNVILTDSAGSEQSGLMRATILTEEGQMRYGFLNADCTEVVIPGELEAVWPFSNGWAQFREGDRWGYMDTEGNVIVSPQYEEAGMFSGTLAPVKWNGLWGFLDENGAEKIVPQYEEYGYSEGQSEITVKKDGKWGLIDEQGNVIIPLQYDVPIFFSEDLAVVLDGEKYGYINRGGEWVIPAQFDNCSPFSEGYAMVEQYEEGDPANSQCTLIDKTGQLVADFGKYFIYGWDGVVNGYITVGFPQYGTGGILSVDGTEIECCQVIWP